VRQLLRNSTGNFTITNFISNSVDIGGGAIDGTVIGGSTANSGAFTTLTASSNVSFDGGTIKLDGNYPVGARNVALGDTALDDGSLTGNDNTAIGHEALTANTSGGQNTALGRSALAANTTGTTNTGLGFSALIASTTGSANSSVGSESLTTNTTGSFNTALGDQALKFNTTASNNTAVGYQAL
jgi:trimeric autotransporter adhesin